MRWPSRDHLPADVLSSLAAHLAEAGVRTPPRVLAWARSADGVAVGLPERFAVLEAGGRWLSQPWHEVQRATWNDEGTLLTWTTVSEPGRPHTVAFADPGRLPELVRERVQQTIVAQQEVQLLPGRPAVLTARRPADGSGPVRWLLTPGRGVDLRDPEVARAAQELIERVSEQWG